MLTALCHGGCGCEVEIRTTPRVCCPNCRIERKRASARSAMERQRRKRGVPRVKGRETTCQSCGICLILNRNAATKFCRPCYLKANAADAPMRSARKRATESGKQYHRQWQKRRRAADPKWRLSSHMRTLIHRGIGKHKAGRSWREFVPYSLEELMAHLEAQFAPGMTWDNHGEWHVDHIRPLCSFEFQTPDDPQFREAWALSNLQPLWAGDNLRKSGKWAA